jgi:hypothetical protein
MTDTMTPITAAEPEGDLDKRKRLMVLGGVGAAAVLGAAGYLLLGGGSSTTASNQPYVPLKSRVAATAAPAKAAALTKAKAVTKPTTVLPAASQVKLGRDPFIALYVQPAAAAPGTTSPGTTPGTTTGTGTATGTTPTGTTPGTTSAATTPYVLQLKSVDSSNPQLRKYTFVVAGRAKSVVQNQKFGKYGELVVLAVTTSSSGKVTGALVQVGDANPFSMKVGEKSTVA